MTKENTHKIEVKRKGEQGTLDAITGASTGNSETSKPKETYQPTKMDLVIEGLDRFLWGQVNGGVTRGDLFLQVCLFLEDHSGPMVKALADLEWDLRHPPWSEKSEEEQDRYMVNNMSDLIWQAAPLEMLEAWYEMMESGEVEEIEIS